MIPLISICIGGIVGGIILAQSINNIIHNIGMAVIALSVLFLFLVPAIVTIKEG